jgi:hypothetical protein
MGYVTTKLGFVPFTGHHASLPRLRHVEKPAAAVRERVGDGIDIMTDFHGRPDSVQAAKAYIDVIAPIRPLFVEEPIQPGKSRAMRDLARRVDCPLVTGAVVHPARLLRTRRKPRRDLRPARSRPFRGLLAQTPDRGDHGGHAHEGGPAQSDGTGGRRPGARPALSGRRRRKGSWRYRP